MNGKHEHERENYLRNSVVEVMMMISQKAGDEKNFYYTKIAILQQVIFFVMLFEIKYIFSRDKQPLGSKSCILLLSMNIIVDVEKINFKMRGNVPSLQLQIGTRCLLYL